MSLDRWSERAAHFGDWGPPLRPPPQAIEAYLRVVARWPWTTHRPLSALLLGVTPELVLAPWPVPLALTAIDVSQPMLDLVWPGDVPGVRRALRADWFSYEPPAAADLVLTDGAPVFFADPVPLFARVRRWLAPHGCFVFRGFCAPPRREAVADVLADARAGRIENFHAFKWRVAMALQPDAAAGVSQHAVWQAITDAGVDYASLPQPGFAAAAVATLRFYEGEAATLHFPTVDQYVAALRRVFAGVEVETPGGLLGERCPVFAAGGHA